MAGQISLYASDDVAIRSEGSVLYDEGLRATIGDIYEFDIQLQQFSSSFNDAYLEYLKLCSLGANNIIFTYLPVRNSSLSFPGGPVPLNLGHIMHGYGFPTFSAVDGSNTLLYDMVDTIRNNVAPLGGTDSSVVQYYSNTLRMLHRRMDLLDATSVATDSFDSIANFFYLLSMDNLYGENVLDGLIDCEDFGIRLQTLSLVNKLLYFSYKEKKVDLEMIKLSRPDDIKKDMAYMIFDLKQSNIGLYKSLFDDTTNQELIDYVSAHASKHYSGTRDVNTLIKNGKREYLRVATLKVLDRYQDGSLDMDKLGIDIPTKISNSMLQYYRKVSKKLRNNPLNIEELNNTILKEDISINDMMKFKYYFENNKNDENYNELKDLFAERFHLGKDFNVDTAISSQYIKLSKDLSLGIGDPMDISTFGGLLHSISSEITSKVNAAHIGIGFNSPNNYSDVLDYIDFTEEDFKHYRHDISDAIPSIGYVKSRYLRSDENIDDLLRVKQKLTSSIVKQVILNTRTVSAAMRMLDSYGCGNYLDIINAVIDTPECMEELKAKFLRGEAVFNMSKISQKCDGLKGLGNAIDNNSGVKIMTAVEDLYYTNTGNRVAPVVDSSSYDTIENYIMFIPGNDPNVGTSVYLELKDVGGLGHYQLVPAHVYTNQRLEYHNYSGKSRVGVTIHVNYSFEHLPLDSASTRFIGSSSSPQDVQLQEMLNPNFNYGTGSVHTGGSSGLGSGH